jgi:nitroimidazol reductase NimA-like FMN-containing flavoprotein (pyridoxamine 5'-phosphate oxidase superfamily)
MSPRRVMEALDSAECMELLAAGGVGRLLYNSRYGPVALPVEYIIHEESVVVRVWATSTEEDLRTGIAHAEYVVAVEVDQADLEVREGWFVLVRGAAHHLDAEAERAQVVDTRLAPWAEGEAESFIQVNPTRIWGNRVHRA